jgi:acylphosphatase
MSGEYKRAHGWVSGMVQGVFFRYFTQDSARKLGLKGWVRNLPDGRVEFVAEGEMGPLNDLIKQVKIGPPASHVAKLDLAWEEYTGEFGNFSIRY